MKSAVPHSSAKPVQALSRIAAGFFRLPELKPRLFNSPPGGGHTGFWFVIALGLLVPCSGLGDACRIIRSDGMEATGEWLDPRITMTTLIGEIELDANRIESVTFQPDPSGLQRVTTVFGDRISGFIKNQTVQIVSKDFKENTLPVDQLLRLQSLEGKESEGFQPPAHHAAVKLLNQDRIHGGVDSSEFSLFEDEAGRVSNLRRILFKDTRSPGATILMKDGSARPHRFDPAKAIVIHPFFGGSVRVPLSRVSSIELNPDLTGESDFTPEDMVWIPPGHFTMGSPSEEEGRDLDEGPRTPVVISGGFWMSVFEVTQESYQMVMKENPSHFIGETRRPVEKVSWYDALRYCEERTRLERTNGVLPERFRYRLPTEAEWEYACRAGTTGPYSFGGNGVVDEIERYAWHAANSDSTTHEVGLKAPNPWGLFDMHGNVWEWCSDIWNGRYPGGEVVDYAGPPTGSLRVARGGSWLYGPEFSRSANRDNYGPNNRCSDVGFRVVLAEERR